MFHFGASFNTFLAQLYAAKFETLPVRVLNRGHNDIRSFIAGDHIDVDSIDWALRSISERATGRLWLGFCPTSTEFHL